MNRSTFETAARGFTAALFALALLGSALPASAAPDCRGRLEFDQDYECRFRSDRTAGATDGVLVFEEFDGNAFLATLDLLDTTSTAYCTCKTGQPGRFDSAKSFECVTGFGPGVAETIEGRVNGNGGKISGGQIWSADPPGAGFARFAFDCELSDARDDEADSDGEDDSEADSDDDDGETDPDDDDGETDPDDDGDSDGEDDSEADSDDDGETDPDDDGDSDGDDDAGAETVTVCHKGKKTLEVPASSVQKHLDHGDTLGACDG